MAQENRQYECILFGATGYTGRYTAEYITSHLPTDFKWAVAGRSQEKLKKLVDELKALNPNRTQPGVEIAQLDKQDLVELAKKTKVLITTVGPYHLYGTVVVEACAETGTHYTDVTGEIPWVHEIVHQYHDAAKKTGAIIIPQNGVESAPADLMSLMLVSKIREELKAGTAEMVFATEEMKTGASGGSLATIMTMFDHYSAADFARSSQPWSLCPPSTEQKTATKPLLERFTGYRSVSDLGTLTDSFQAASDTPIVGRSWYLYDKFYGPAFHFSAYMRVRNALLGLVVHIALLVAPAVLLLAPVRRLLHRFLRQPGDEPTKE